MSNDTSNPKLRIFADSLVDAEAFINDLVEMLTSQGTPIRLEAEVLQQPHLPDRIHLRMVTPGMEVRNDLPAARGKAALRPVARKAAE